MTASNGSNLRLDDLAGEITLLRGKLAAGAPILPLASVRSRDRAEPVYGTVLPLTLASSLFFDDQFGEYAAMDKPRIYLFEGTLTGRHITSLVPIFEEVARERGPLMLAATEVDEDVLAMVALNKRRGSMRGSIVLPSPVTSPGRPPPLQLLQRITGAGIGAATEAGLRIEPPASALRVLSTLHETVILGARQLASEWPSLGLLHIGGEDIADARARARAVRDMLAKARLS